MAVELRSLLILFLVSLSFADDIDFAVSNSILIKALREMTNQTSADSLNLPANASSIRENITDTFSCENRTYGYYADVDNECQVFHVCLPSQTPGGRNVTYRYSFICPAETIFNQEVLTCTRPIDSIPCEESPNFYHVNMEIGKESNKTAENDNKKENRKIQKRKEIKRKDNYVMENLIKDIIKDEIKDKLEAIELGVKNAEIEESPMLIEAVIENIEPESSQEEKEKEDDLDRIIMERNMRNERQMRRGGFRFKSDVKIAEETE